MNSSNALAGFWYLKTWTEERRTNNLIILKSWYVVMEFTGCLKNFNNSPKTSIFFTNHRYLFDLHQFAPRCTLQQLTTESCLTAEWNSRPSVAPSRPNWVTQYWVSNETRPLSCAQLSKCLFFATMQREAEKRKKIFGIIEL